MWLNNFETMKNGTASYQNNEEKPYLHLVDGGLTDNLGLASLLDMSDLLTVKIVAGLKITIYAILSW